MEDFKLVCPCMLGVEGLVADELRRMEAEEVEAQNGRVVFAGSEEMLARANLWSRCGERIQILMGEFSARSFEELFQGVRALPWERWIGKRDAFPVKGSCLSSQLASVPDCQSIVKKAVVERLKRKYSLQWFEETGTKYQIQFLILKDRVSLMIDTSGEGLHKRGYRANSAVAPIKETLAASMASLSRVRRDARLIDPFCGSGTILIEGAIHARNIAPGISRGFAAEGFSQIGKAVWQRERERARELEKRDVPFEGFGYDSDPSAVSLTLENAKKAGVGDCIRAEKKEISRFRADGDSGCVICNPPYGERLLDVNQARELYRAMGKAFERRHFWSYSIISPDETFEACFGRKADKRRKLYNGMIRCQYYMYFK